jgi:preprotein translocase subunit SecD
MMNRYPLWKNLLIIAVVLVSVIYALPNVYGEDPALQVTSARAGKLEAGVQQRVEDALKKAGIAYKSIAATDQEILVRFNSTDVQLKAVDFIKADLGGNFVVALNLAPSTPKWLQSLNALPMYLGLDLRGGVYFLTPPSSRPSIAMPAICARCSANRRSVTARSARMPAACALC